VDFRAASKSTTNSLAMGVKSLVDRAKALVGEAVGLLNTSGLKLRGVEGVYEHPEAEVSGLSIIDIEEIMPAGRRLRH